MLTGAIREIFRTNLGVKRDERVLVFTDRPTRRDVPSEDDLKRWSGLRDVVMLVVEIGRAFARECTLYTFNSRGGHGIEPPEGLWRAAFGERTVERLKERGLLRAIIRKAAADEQIKEAEGVIRRYRGRAFDVVIALSNYSTSHTRFRDFLTRLCGTRYASMPLFDVEMFEGAMDVDWRQIERLTRSVARAVNAAYWVHIYTPNGTDIALSKKGRKALSDTGNLRMPGSFGNLPAGEVFFAPVEGSANGRLVLEWAPTRRLSSPIVLTVQEGRVTDVEGNDGFVEVLMAKLSERHENANIAELGIGTNNKAIRPFNILEAEKLLGTVHIALGDNSSFGGKVKTPFHQDFVFFHPTVVLKLKSSEEMTLIEEGRMLVQGL